MGRPRIFGILGAQQQEHHIDPFNGITCYLQGFEPGRGGYQPFLPTTQVVSNVKE
jgi:hypothetical protein